MFNKKELNLINAKLDALADHLGVDFTVKFCEDCGSPLMVVEPIEDEDCCDCNLGEYCDCPCHWEDENGKCN